MISRGLVTPTILRGQRRFASEIPTLPPRPEGRVLWAHCDSRDMVEEIVELLPVIRETGVSVVVTCEETVDDTPEVNVTVLGPDTRGFSKTFFAHLKPDLAVWASNIFRPKLLMRARRLGVPILYVNAASHFDPSNWRKKLPSMSLHMLDTFDHILAVGEQSARRLKTAGLSPDKVEITGQLQSMGAGPPLPVVEEERARVARHLAGRPVWFVADVAPREVVRVVRAQRKAARLVQGLLLIIETKSDDMQALVKKACKDHNLRCGYRERDDLPNAADQVFIVTDAEERGLWYRVSPGTYLSGSVSNGMATHPFDPAALGSAIVSGPLFGKFAKPCRRLQDGGAMRLLEEGEKLSEALCEVAMPDEAARLAHAAWEVTSAGAEAADRTVEWITEQVEKLNHAERT